ncbi:hypothetical protein BT69DRAFT_1315773 [Atractiella rhizophila]|nr:hypothetical protein BT69DRAFT_1315773 [Atractiella rhizophila]
MTRAYAFPASEAHETPRDWDLDHHKTQGYWSSAQAMGFTTTNWIYERFCQAVDHGSSTLADGITVEEVKFEPTFKDKFVLWFISYYWDIFFTLVAGLIALGIYALRLRKQNASLSLFKPQLGSNREEKIQLALQDRDRELEAVRRLYVEASALLEKKTEEANEVVRVQGDLALLEAGRKAVEAEKDELSKKLDGKTMEAEKLEKELDELKEEISSLKMEQKELGEQHQQQIEELEAAVAEEKAAKVEKESQLLKLNEELDSQKSSHSRSTSEVESLKSSLADLRSSYTSLEASQSDIVSSKSSLESRIQSLQSENASLSASSSRFEAVESELAELKQKERERSAEVEQLENELQGKEAKVQELTNKLDDYAERQKTLEQTMQENETLRAAIKKLKASSSEDNTGEVGDTTEVGSEEGSE